MKSVKRGTYARRQKFRRTLVEVHEIEGWRVTSTPDHLLGRLLPVQLTLVPDMDAVIEPTPETPMRPVAQIHTDESWDEYESTRYFKERMRLGEGVVIPLRPWGLGGDEFGGVA